MEAKKLSPEQFKVLSGENHGNIFQNNPVGYGVHQGGINIHSTEQFMQGAEVLLQNLIELAKFEVKKEQAGSRQNTEKITLIYNLIEFKKQELAMIYNYIKKYR